MSNCLDTDTLVGVGAAIGWETEDTLRHIATCQECHEELRRLAKLHGVLNDQLQPMPGFTARVLGGLRAPDPTPRSHRRWSFVGAFNGLLAGGTAFFAIALGSAGSAPVSFGPPVLVVAMVVAIATAWWNQVNRGRLMES